MGFITAQQIKAARGLLDWGQEDLAQASGLAVKTVRTVENGGRSPQTLHAVQRALEQQGIELIGEVGVKLRDDQIRKIRGRCAYEPFTEAVCRAMARADGEMLFAGRSLDLLARAFGVNHFADRDLADLLEPLGPLRCLIASPPSQLAQAAFWPGLTCRLTNENEVGASAYFVFGDKAAEIRRESCGDVWFVLFDLDSVANEFRHHFQAVWAGAAALPGLAAGRTRPASRRMVEANRMVEATRTAQIARLVVAQTDVPLSDLAASDLAS